MESRLISLGEKIHDALVAAYIRGDAHYAEKLGGACAVGSYLLTQEAKRLFKMNVIFTASWGHAWTEFRGRIYDITATQFGRKEKVFSIAKSELDSLGEDTIGYYYSKTKKITLEEINKTWPDYQKPINYQLKWLFDTKAHLIYNPKP